MTWAWRRWIAASEQDDWTARLEAAGYQTWTLTERPDRVRVLLAIYLEKRTGAAALRQRFGGTVRMIRKSEWIHTRPSPPTRIGGKLEILHEETTRMPSKRMQLRIPHGMAFGSGEHATTRMLLLAVSRLENWKDIAVLDLGTGSGVLALAARLFGAQKITATDFDKDAVRIACQNEALNFSAPKVRWRCEDVNRLCPVTKYDLVLANLFSGILCEAAPQITASVALGGRLWLSGILRVQEQLVIAAYRRERLKLIRTVHQGKWVMLQWNKLR